MKSVLRTLAGEILSVPPIWLMRQAGRYLPEYRALRERAADFLAFCLTPELAAEATLQPVRRFGFDAAILFSDILVIPHALGQRVWFAAGEGPQLDPVRDRRAIDGLSGDGSIERIRPVLETIRQAKAALDPNVALIGFAGSPWTVATYMVEGSGSREFVHVKRLASNEPAAFQRLIDRIVETTIVYLEEQVSAGADVLQLFDSWAGVLSEGSFRRWVIEPTARIVAELHHRRPGIPIIGFPRGAGLMLETYLRETGVDALSLDTTVPLLWARTHLQALRPMQGNLDPVTLLAGGGAMNDAVRAILDTLGQGPLVFNLGHGILPETPVEHVAELARLVRERSIAG